MTRLVGRADKCGAPRKAMTPTGLLRRAIGIVGGVLLLSALGPCIAWGASSPSSLGASPASVQRGQSVEFTGAVPAQTTGSAPCSLVAIDSAAFTTTATSSPLPILVAVGANAQFTVTVHIPDQEAPGHYTATAACAPLSGGAASAPFAVVSFEVRSTLPFDSGAHPAAQWGALGSVLAAAAVLFLFLRRRPSVLVLGKDGRLSTSKTIALLWTPVVGYIVVTLAYIAIGAKSFGVWHVLVGSPVGVYLVLLGGPFAGLVGAQTIVRAQVANGTLQKPDANRPHVSDLFSDDDGNVDIVDTQYLFFNIIAVTVVLAQFISRPGFGAPDVPWFLAALTGTSAATYLTNKALGNNAPSISQVVPGQARIGQMLQAHGVNLSPAGAGDTKPAVTVGGYLVDVSSETAADTQVEFRVPSPASGTLYPAGPQQVVLTTVGKLVAVADQAVTIIPDAAAPQRLDPLQAQASHTFSVYGQNLFDASDLDFNANALDTAESTVTIQLASGARISCARQQLPAARSDGDTQVTAIIPDGTAAGSYDVFVRGTRLPGAQLTVVP